MEYIAIIIIAYVEVGIFIHKLSCEIGSTVVATSKRKAPSQLKDEPKTKLLKPEKDTVSRYDCTFLVSVFQIHLFKYFNL